MRINQKSYAKSKGKYDSRGRCSCNGICGKMWKCHGLCGGKECGGNIDQTTNNTPKRRRKRFKHNLQETPTKKSLSFMQDRGENVHIGDPNLLEYYDIYSLVLTFDSSHQVSAEEIHKLFVGLINILVNFGFNLPINLRTMKEIKKLLQKFTRIKQVIHAILHGGNA